MVVGLGLAPTASLIPYTTAGASPCPTITLDITPITKIYNPDIERNII